MLLEYKSYLKEKKKDELAGVVVIYKNKILLVKPKKFKQKVKKWSIPKGHIENNDILQTAIDELREESRVKLSPQLLKTSPTDKIIYKKNGIKKKLTYFIVRVKKSDLNIKLFNDMILGHNLKGETREAGFFTKQDAKKLMEFHQLDVLKYLE